MDRNDGVKRDKVTLCMDRLRLARRLIDHDMSAGAAMAFLVSGGVVSIWGAMAIFLVLRS